MLVYINGSFTLCCCRETKARHENFESRQPLSKLTTQRQAREVWEKSDGADRPNSRSVWDRLNGPAAALHVMSYHASHCCPPLPPYSLSRSMCGSRRTAAILLVSNSCTTYEGPARRELRQLHAAIARTPCSGCTQRHSTNTHRSGRLHSPSHASHAAQHHALNKQAQPTHRFSPTLPAAHSLSPL